MKCLIFVSTVEEIDVKSIGIIEGFDYCAFYDTEQDKHIRGMIYDDLVRDLGVGNSEEYSIAKSGTFFNLSVPTGEVVGYYQILDMNPPQQEYEVTMTRTRVVNLMECSGQDAINAALEMYDSGDASAEFTQSPVCTAKLAEGVGE